MIRNTASVNAGCMPRAYIAMINLPREPDSRRRMPIGLWLRGPGRRGHGRGWLGLRRIARSLPYKSKQYFMNAAGGDLISLLLNPAPSTRFLCSLMTLCPWGPSCFMSQT
jgi:hypothetical protein